MPKVEFKGKTLQLAQGANLRKALKSAGLAPHNGQSSWLNCKGLGTCGTCAVEVLSGQVNEPSPQEKWRLNIAPHQAEHGLRLACQIEVNHDLKLKKHPGFWGEKKP